MYLLKVNDDIKTELNLIRESLSPREGNEVSYSYAIGELLKFYKEYSKNYRK